MTLREDRATIGKFHQTAQGHPACVNLRGENLNLRIILTLRIDIEKHVNHTHILQKQNVSFTLRE